MMKTKPSTEYALLGALMSGPRHGYEIMQFLDTALGSTWHVGTSQLYVLLKKLERDNLLCSDLEIQDTRPSKRIFSMTPGGKKVFMDWLKSPTKHVRDLRIEFLAKLFFFYMLSLKGADELINAQVQVLKQMREGIRQKREKEKDPFSRLVLEFKMITVEACIQWLVEQAAPFIQDSFYGRIE
jgi:PadR family transcriptional regulator AphA